MEVRKGRKTGVKGIQKQTTALGKEEEEKKGPLNHKDVGYTSAL